MPERHHVIAWTGALAVAATIGWTAPARALVTNTTKFSGTATGSGTVSRTITDISEPNAPPGGTGIQGVQAGFVSVPVTTGKTANQIGWAFRDSINTNASLIATGYSASFSGGDSSLVVMGRATGNFSVLDGNTVPGVTMTIVGWSGGGTGAGPALSPWALVLLGAGLAALVWRRQRQQRA